MSQQRCVSDFCSSSVSVGVVTTRFGAATGNDILIDQQKYGVGLWHPLNNDTSGLLGSPKQGCGAMHD